MTYYSAKTSNKLKKNFLLVNNTQARKFLLKHGFASSSFHLPEYYKPAGFDLIKLNKINWSSMSTSKKDPPKITKTLDILTPKSYLSWRSFNFSNPYIFVHIVKTMTEKANWELIRKILTQNTLVNSYSLPVLSLAKNKTIGSTSITNWLQMAEKDLIKDCSDFSCLTVTDIKNFYPTIYTHSIAWAIHGKKQMKSGSNRNNYSLLGNKLDKLFQNSRDGQTNGIPVGSLVSDIVAEIILTDIDKKLSEKLIKDELQKKVLIFRYRDDYKVLSQNPEQGKAVLHHLTKILNQEYDLYLNSDKTNLYTDILEGSFRPWMLEIKKSNFLRKIYYSDLEDCKTTNDLKDCLIETYRIQKAFPSGRASVSILSKLVEALHKDNNKIEINHEDIPELISILRKLTLLKEEVTPTTYILFDILLNKIKTKAEKKTILNTIKKVVSGKNDQAYQLIWFYRLCLHHCPDMCAPLLSNNDIPLLRVLGSYYSNDFEIFETIQNINASEKAELNNFVLIDRSKLTNSKNLSMNPKYINPFKAFMY